MVKPVYSIRQILFIRNLPYVFYVLLRLRSVPNVQHVKASGFYRLCQYFITDRPLEREVAVPHILVRDTCRDAPRVPRAALPAVRIACFMTSTTWGDLCRVVALFFAAYIALLRKKVCII